MQLALIVPFIAIVFYKSESGGLVICFLLMVANFLINMHYTFKYDLKIGFINVNNYNLLTGIIGKPWTKLYDVALGFMLAYFYHFKLLKYRQLKSHE
jgi:hypothetical protein